MTKISFSFLLIIFITGCATTPSIDPKDITPAPQMAKDLGAELTKRLIVEFLVA